MTSSYWMDDVNYIIHIGTKYRSLFSTIKKTCRTHEVNFFLQLSYLRIQVSKFESMTTCLK